MKSREKKEKPDRSGEEKTVTERTRSPASEKKKNPKRGPERGIAFEGGNEKKNGAVSGQELGREILQT